jgi:hypothetical protein
MNTKAMSDSHHFPVSAQFSSHGDKYKETEKQTERYDARLLHGLRSDRARNRRLEFLTGTGNKQTERVTDEEESHNMPDFHSVFPFSEFDFKRSFTETGKLYCISFSTSVHKKDTMRISKSPRNHSNAVPLE